MGNYENKYGYNLSIKLWKRIIRIRKIILNCEENETDKMWNQYITEAFKDEIELEIQELTNKLDPTRTIHYE